MARFTSILALALISCGSGKDSRYTYCQRDADCPNGMVCDEDDPNDSYCTPACNTDSDCPSQVTCPGESSTGPHCENERQAESQARNVCDQFQGYYGPNSCKTASPSSGNHHSGGCTSDGECSSHCSDDCYQCLSGSCSCGYRGVSGSCIF
jgi:hypothetical protein